MAGLGLGGGDGSGEDGGCSWLELGCLESGWLGDAGGTGLAVKHQRATNTGVIDADYRGEVKVVLVNQGNQPYHVEQRERIAELIIEKIKNEEL